MVMVLFAYDSNIEDLVCDARPHRRVIHRELLVNLGLYGFSNIIL